MKAEYLDTEGIRNAFSRYLMENRGYDEDDAEYAASDFPDPYAQCYLMEEYLGECEIDGEKYEQYTSWTDFSMMMGMDSLPHFGFYTYYRSSDMPGHLVKEYRAAKKYYSVNNIKKKDFSVKNIWTEK